MKPELVRGRGGVFEVTLGNELVFSKKATRRFPGSGEVVRELEARLGES